MGGTSTDISLISEGRASLSADGMKLAFTFGNLAYIADADAANGAELDQLDRDEAANGLVEQQLERGRAGVVAHER